MTEDPAAGEPCYDETEAAGLIGKHVLVGITWRDHDDGVISREQFHGVIVRTSEQEGIIIRCAGGEERMIPPDVRALEPAAPGEYRLRESGEIVVDPDFISTWNVHPPEDDPPGEVPPDGLAA